MASPTPTKERRPSPGHRGPSARSQTQLRRAAVPRETRAGTRVHRIESRRPWLPKLSDVRREKDLLVLLSLRQITVTYRQTILGPAWIFLSPLLSAGLFSFVFGSVAHLKDGDIPYFAFSYAGLVVWNLFSTILTGTAGSLTANSALISKIYFPRLLLPLSTIAASVVPLVLSLGVMTLLLVVYGLGFSLHLVLLPVWLLLGAVMAVGVGLILTSVSVKYRDINNATPMLIPLFLYLTPVAYATDNVPADLRTVFLLNPVATVVEGCRWSILGEGTLSGWGVAYTAVMTLVLLTVGLITFARLEWGFADVI